MHVPTLPAVPSLGADDDRTALLAGLTFVEGVARGWGFTEVSSWIHEHLVLPGRMARPSALREPPIGTVSLSVDPRTGAGVGSLEEVPKLLQGARTRVAATLRGLIAKPSDDRFLRAAI